MKIRKSKRNGEGDLGDRRVKCEYDFGLDVELKISYKRYDWDNLGNFKLDYIQDIVVLLFNLLEITIMQLFRDEKRENIK